MSFEDCTQELRELIKKGELASAINLLENECDLKKNIEIELLIFRYNALQRDYSGGTIDDNNKRIEETRISRALLEIFLDNNPLELMEEKKKSRQKAPLHLTEPPLLSEFFIGRKRELKKIHDSFYKNNNLLLLLNGPGGIGKTSLAAQYYHQYGDYYKNVAWVLGDKSIIEGLLNLAPILNIPFSKQQDSFQRLEILIPYLVNLEDPCLLIIDNANNINDFKIAYVYLRKLVNFHILVTTRMGRYSNAPILEVTGIGEENAINLFKEFYQDLKPSEEEMVKDIYRAIGCNTLVIELLSKFLGGVNKNLEKRPIENLLKDLRQKGLLHSVKQEIPKEVITEHQKLKSAKPDEIISTLYDISKLSDKENQLLSVFSVLPVEGVSYEILSQLLVYLSEFDLENQLSSLSLKGWLKHQKDQEKVSTYKCSPVIQEIVRHKQKEILDHCKPMIGQLKKILEYDGKHLKKPAKELTGFAEYAESIVTLLPIDSIDLASLCDHIGSYNQITGNLNKALGFFGKQSEIGEKLEKGNESNNSFIELKAIANEKLGSIYMDLNEPHQAVLFYKKNLESREKIFNQHRGNTEFKRRLVVAFEKLGEAYYASSDLSSALDTCIEGYQIAKELFSKEKSNELHIYHLAIANKNLGLIHFELQEYDIAFTNFAIFLLLIQRNCENFKKDKYRYQLAMANEKLGIYFLEIGKNDQALAVFETENLVIQKLKEKDPENAFVKLSLALSYEKLGSASFNLGFLQKALNHFKEYNKLINELSTSFPQIIRYKNDLAVSFSRIGQIYINLGNLKKALEFFQEDLKLTKKLNELIPQNTDYKTNLAISFQKLGGIYMDSGDLKKAYQYFEDAFRLIESLRESPSNYKDLESIQATIYLKLGEVYDKIGDMKRAMEFFEMSYQLQKGLIEKDQQNILLKYNLSMILLKFGKTYFESGNPLEARSYFEKSLSLAKKAYKSNPGNIDFKYSVFNAYSKLGEAHISLGNYFLGVGFIKRGKWFGEALIVGYTQDILFNKSLALTNLSLAKAFLILGRVNQDLKEANIAMEYFEESLKTLHYSSELIFELYNSDEDNAEFKYIYALVTLSLGDVNEKLNNTFEALEYYINGHMLLKELCLLDILNADYKDRLASSYAKLGIFYQIYFKNTNKAKDAFLNSQKIWVDLIKKFSGNPKYKNNFHWLKKKMKELKL